jgi:sugar transferase EpsL
MNTDAIGLRLRLGVKRLGDVIAAAVCLIVFSILLVGIALVVAVTTGTPVLFKQTRLGRNGRPFKLLKFRTMTDERDDEGNPLSDAERLTSVGRFLRQWSLDELPGLVNVLKGDMSMVGPRPLLPEYWDLYSQEQRRRHHLPPGMAGPVRQAVATPLPGRRSSSSTSGTWTTGPCDLI